MAVIRNMGGGNIESVLYVIQPGNAWVVTIATHDMFQIVDLTNGTSWTWTGSGFVYAFGQIVGGVLSSVIVDEPLALSRREIVGFSVDVATMNATPSLGLFGGAGRYYLMNAGNDLIYGDFSKRDVLYGGVGIDYIYGYGGDDHLFGDQDTDFIYGGAGSDFILGGVGEDYLYGDSGVIETGGGASNDTIDGGPGNDIILGGDGFDWLSGGTGADWIYGGDGSDVINGDTGDDVLIGDIVGESGFDNLVGGDGSDILIGGTGDDTLYGGAQMEFSASGTAVEIDWLFGGNGADVMHGGAGVDILYGDLFDGEIGADQLFGGDGDDILLAGGGADNLVGGNGNDWMYGQAGNDQLTGGAGADLFWFQIMFDGVDTITDFSRAQGDKIVLYPVHVGLGYGNQTTAQAFMNGIYQLVQNGSHVNLLVDPDGSGGPQAGTLLATINNTTVGALSSTIDFI